MVVLKPYECRVLGVQVEKAHTTPQQYPLTLNALVNGCNQKNNRHPVTNLSDDDVLEAVDGLRGKGLVREAMMSGSRVAKYRHNAREVMEVDTPQLVILTELLLRGPQTIGELRGRASRMHDLGSLEQVQDVVNGLMARQPACVRELPPEPGSRANRFVQLLCPNLHPIETAASGAAPATASRSVGGENRPHDRGLEARVAQLERTVARLKAIIEQSASLQSAEQQAD